MGLPVENEFQAFKAYPQQKGHQSYSFKNIFNNIPLS